MPLFRIMLTCSGGHSKLKASLLHQEVREHPWDPGRKRYAGRADACRGWGPFRRAQWSCWVLVVSPFWRWGLKF